jgi:hypothetical protein
MAMIAVAKNNNIDDGLIISDLLGAQGSNFLAEFAGEPACMCNMDLRVSVISRVTE